MGIEDIVRERQAAAAQAAPRSQREARQMANQQRQARTDGGSDSGSSGGGRTDGSLQINLPDPRSGDREDILFWLNVVQTAALVLLLLRR